ncbi:MAG: hypothetical protein GYB64_11075 [Chloroflexi bacterium]|nr:hypothetical protein [Chloroflexota bacterium]
MSDDILTEPAPTDPVALHNPDISDIAKRFDRHLWPKWGPDYPSEFLMLSFGYLKEFEQTGGISTYLLTEKAFTLLERPPSAPSVFISYRRRETCARARIGRRGCASALGYATY